MKSTVLTIAMSSVRRYTAASSEVSNPTNRSGLDGALNPCSASDNTVGPILAAQPQVRERPVRVLFRPNSLRMSMRDFPLIRQFRFGIAMLDTLISALSMPRKFESPLPT
jgi:hypothetical protein